MKFKIYRIKVSRTNVNLLWYIKVYEHYTIHIMPRAAVTLIWIIAQTRRNWHWSRSGFLNNPCVSCDILVHAVHFRFDINAHIRDYLDNPFFLNGALASVL